MRIIILGLGCAFAVCIARLANACGVPDLGEVVDAMAAMLPARTSVSAPIIVVGVGVSSDETALGLPETASLGWGWGERDRGGLVPGVAVQRVLATIHVDHGAMAALTYGWYMNYGLTLGLDAGVAADVTGTRGLGPITQFTIGLHAFAVQLGSAALYAPERTVVNTVELVVEVSDLISLI